MYKVYIAIIVIIILGWLALFLTRQTILSQIDFKTLKTPTRPNWYLVCPKDLCEGKQQQVSPVFKISLQQLQTAWTHLIAKQPRVTKIASNIDNTQMTYIQRSRIMHYPDTINIRLIAINPNESTIAIYSASHYGYSDMGVNKHRVQSWLNQLIKMEKSGRTRF